MPVNNDDRCAWGSMTGQEVSWCPHERAPGRGWPHQQMHEVMEAQAAAAERTALALEAARRDAPASGATAVDVVKAAFALLTPEQRAEVCAEYGYVQASD